MDLATRRGASSNQRSTPHTLPDKPQDPTTVADPENQSTILIAKPIGQPKGRDTRSEKQPDPATQQTSSTQPTANIIEIDDDANKSNTQPSTRRLSIAGSNAGIEDAEENAIEPGLEHDMQVAETALATSSPAPLIIGGINFTSRVAQSRRKRSTLKKEIAESSKQQAAKASTGGTGFASAL